MNTTDWARSTLNPAALDDVVQAATAVIAEAVEAGKWAQSQAEFAAIMARRFGLRPPDPDSHIFTHRVIKQITADGLGFTDLGFLWLGSTSSKIAVQVVVSRALPGHTQPEDVYPDVAVQVCRAILDAVPSATGPYDGFMFDVPLT